jgi:hypothetical protein
MVALINFCIALSKLVDIIKQHSKYFVHLKVSFLIKFDLNLLKLLTLQI